LLWRDFIPPESATSHHPLLHEKDIFLIVYQQTPDQILLSPWITLIAMAGLAAGLGAAGTVIAIAEFANKVFEDIHKVYSAYRSAPRVMLELADHITACLVQMDFFQQNVDDSELPLSPILKTVVDYHRSCKRSILF
jgi:hypothetical protein